MSLRVASYSRVSTSHHEQNPQIQVEELRRYCEGREGWQVVEELVDHGISGGSTNRPGLQRLLAMARNKEIDAIVIVKLDRLFRSLKHLVTTLDEFQELGVVFVAVRDNVDYTSPSGRLLVQVLGSLAEFEKSLLRERTKMGLDYARSKGVKLGRPSNGDLTRIPSLRAQGLSYREIRTEIGCSLATIARVLNAVPKGKISQAIAPTVL